MRVISGPNFTKIFLFKLISLVRCPEMAVCSASVKRTLFYREGKTTDVLPLLQWSPLEIQKEFEGGEGLILSGLIREVFI